MPRAPSSKPKKRTALKPLDKQAQKQSSLAQELREEELRNKYGRVSAPGRRKPKKGDTDPDDEMETDGPGGRITGAQVHGSTGGGAGTFVDPKLSRNILRLAQEQQAEIEAEEEAERLGVDPRMHLRQQEDEEAGKTVRFGRQVVLADDDDISSDDGELDEAEAESGDEDIEATYRELELDPSQRELIEELEGPVGERRRERAGAKLAGEFADLADALPDQDEQPAGGRTLADIIMAKLAEQEAMKASGGQSAPQNQLPPGLTTKAVEVYTKVGQLLSRYKSGPLPKPLKVIPSMPAWETLLYMTNPQEWTPHATLAVTRIMVSNLKAYQTQRYFELVLLDKVRDEIDDNGKLSVQMYDAIKKALYKPSAFFKGFLFPMVESGTLTLKEAAIISSVLQKVSVPMLHSAAALLHLATMPYKGPTSLFIRVLLDKKYALPYKVVDALVFHFLKFSDPEKGVEVVKVDGYSTGERRMPVLWHQSLLVFVQRYKQDLTPDQKTALIDLLRVQYHEGISPEVRRELVNSTARGELLEEPMGDGDAWSDDDDAMSV